MNSRSVPISQSAHPLVSIMQPYYVHANSIPYNGLQNEQTLSNILWGETNGWLCADDHVQKDFF